MGVVIKVLPVLLVVVVAAVAALLAYRAGQKSLGIQWDRYTRMETLVLDLTDPVSSLTAAEEIPVLPAAQDTAARALRAEIEAESARIRAYRRRRGF